MSEERILRLVGLARRAGKLSPGLDATLQALATGSAKLVLVAGDAGGSTRRKVERLAEERGCPVVVIADSEALGQMSGAARRAVLGVLDEGFARGIADIRLCE